MNSQQMKSFGRIKSIVNSGNQDHSGKLQLEMTRNGGTDIAVEYKFILHYYDRKIAGDVLADTRPLHRIKAQAYNLKSKLTSSGVCGARKPDTD